MTRALLRRLLALLLAAGAIAHAGAAPPAPAPGLPAYEHVVVVIMENHQLAQVLDRHVAPWLAGLPYRGASLTDSHGVTHPSEPNYLALFSGSTHGVTDDRCPLRFDGPNIATQMLAAGKTFLGYAEDLPADPAACYVEPYARKHNPWVNFANVPASVNRPFSEFPADFTTLPHLAFVVPNMINDMHDGTIAQGDAWLRKHFDGYAQWAKTHESLLIVTFDEDDYATKANLIPTFFVGAHVKTGKFGGRVDHTNVLATIGAIFGLPPLTAAPPITNVFEPR